MMEGHEDVPWYQNIDYEYVRDHFGSSYDDVLDLMDEHDPIGLGAPKGHYRPEVSTILLRLEGEKPTCETDVLTIVHEEFMRWFTSPPDFSPRDEGIAGPRELYRHLAHDVWNVWQRASRRPS